MYAQLLGLWTHQTQESYIPTDEDDRQPLLLLCFEDTAKGEQCHRRVFADWWLEQTEQDLPELNNYDQLPTR